jgi:uncharacterized membrane protein YhiD involved in acid resistance
MQRSNTDSWRLVACAVTVGAAATAALHAQTLPAAAPGDASLSLATVGEQVYSALIRLPLAGLLGTALALRPKRLGTPARTMSVIETQIVLAIVGALIMLVVGASLARAFGIVGAANLIRYRAKIENPKDAVVMLAALAVGLACGVGLYVLSVIGTVLVGAALWIIEGFEPQAHKSFDLSIAVKNGNVADLRPGIENVLRRFHTRFELRSSADDAVSYAVEAPPDMRVDRVSNAIESLAGDAGLAVQWDPMKEKKAS